MQRNSKPKHGNTEQNGGRKTGSISGNMIRFIGSEKDCVGRSNKVNNRVVPVYQSIKDTVKSTGLSDWYLRKLLKANQLPHIRSGSKIYVNVDALLRQLEEGLPNG